MNNETPFDTLNGAAEQLKKAMGDFQGIDKITEFAENILPKDKFTAEIDGHKVDVSIGFSGRMIMIEFQDDIKGRSIHAEMKQNTEGLKSVIKRIFSK